MSDLYEQLASIQHDIWASWQEHVHTNKLTYHYLDRNYTLEREDVARWKRQIKAPYSELSEKEKDSDREQVDKFWHLIVEQESKVTALEADLKKSRRQTAAAKHTRFMMDVDGTTTADCAVYCIEEIDEKDAKVTALEADAKGNTVNVDGLIVGYHMIVSWRERIKELEAEVKAADAALKYADELQLSSPWVAVETELPTEEKEYLVWPRPSPDYHIISAVYYPWDKTWNYDQHDGYDFSDHKATVTHWADLPPIPATPEEASDNE